MSAPIELKPGEKVLQRYLLPDGLEPNSAGDFDYRVERGVTFDARDGSHKVQKVSGTFTVHEVESDGARLRADDASLVAELESPDPQQRWLAATAITQHPQGFLESVILRLSRRPETINASITGLQKLGSDEAKRRLAELTDSGYEESTRQPATTALAELGDKSYCDVMLQVMSLRQGYSSDIAARGAGLLCGERAIPQLVALSSSPSMFPAYEVAYALGNTGSRNAVPALIELLHTVDGEQLRAIQEALYTLTHRRSSSGKSGADEYQEWTNWWAFEGKTAQIFDPSECP